MTDWLFWIMAGLLVLVTAALVAMPLLRRSAEAVEAEAFNRAVFKDQLTEIDRDLDRGLIGPAEAEAAKLEISRRLLSASEAAGDPGPAMGAEPPPMRRPGWVLGGGLAALVPALALALYLPIGRPDLENAPFVARDVAPATDLAAASQDIERLRDRLLATPEDIDGWMELGERLFGLSRYSDAANAFQVASRLTGGDPRVLNLFGESLVRANEGIVTGQAKAAFARVLEIAPRNPMAQFFMALSILQEGDHEQALARFRALYVQSPPGAPWEEAVRFRILEMAARLGIPQDQAIPERTDSPPPVATAPGPTQDQVAAFAGLTDQEREDAIRGMVDGLAARLEDSPEDLDGWVRLANAYGVLGQPGDAADALARALDLRPDDAALIAQFIDASFQAGRLTGPLDPSMRTAMERLLAADPSAMRPLWFLGLEAATTGETGRARDLWSRLADQLPPGSNEHRVLQNRLLALERPPAGG